MPAGIEWRTVVVTDPFTTTSASAESLRRRLAGWNSDFLVGKVKKVAPTVDRYGVLHLANNVSHEVCRNPGMSAWRTRLVPSALALLPLQDPTVRHLPGEKPVDIDPATRAFFTHSIDAIAIRSRATLMSDVACGALSRHDGRAPFRMLSVASGTAVPVIGAIKRMNAPAVHLTLVDIDSSAQAMAAEHLEQAGIPGLEAEHRFQDIVMGLVITDRLVDEIGEGAYDFVDALGIFEYIPDHRGRAATFLRNLYRLVRPGGTLVLGNMLDSHPQLALNQYGIGWPSIHPRSRHQLLDLMVAAGVPLDEAVGHQALDGVYAVVELRKPESTRQPRPVRTG